MDTAPRHFFEKKLHFSVAKEEADNITSSGKKSCLKISTRNFSEGDPGTFYTYVSSCEVPPKVPGKKSFLDFSMSIDDS